MLLAVSPFDLKEVLLVKHAQHVVLVHFPIALLLTGVAFDFAGQWLKKPILSVVARYNLAIAAIATIPVAVAARRPQTQGNSVAASGDGRALEHPHLAGFLGALSRFSLA